MLDVHSHILPRLDDGAQSWHDTIRMARLAVQGGTSHIVCTPHCSSDDNELPARLSRILDETREANRRLRALEIPLRLHPGMELLCVSSPHRLLERGIFLTLAGSRYLLIEFPFEVPATAIFEAASAVSHYGLCPVIAHPERYDCVQWSPRVAQAWFDRGWVLQLNRGSLTGGFGPEAGEAAFYLLRRGLAHLVASDAHRPDFRTPDLSEGDRWVRQNFSDAYAELLLERNPGRILADRSVTALPF